MTADTTQAAERLAEIRQHRGANLSSCWMNITFLLILLDARDARIAELEAALVDYEELKFRMAGLDK